MDSNLPIPPEEHKLKDDYIVTLQVRVVALIFNDMPFQTTSQNRKPLFGHILCIALFSF